MLIKGNCSKCGKYGDLQPRGSFVNEGICEKCIDKEKEEIRQEEERVEKERRLRIRESLTPALECLARGDFLNADKIILDSQTEEGLKEYERIKFEEYISPDLRELENALGKEFDDEKAAVLSTTGKDVLVQARAGSGKTTTIALKVRQLVKFYGAKPSEILVLAFNKNAADIFRGRINEYCSSQIIANKSNTLTFHALASRIVNSNKKLLYDVKGKYEKDVEQQCSKESQTDFVEQCFDDVKKRNNHKIIRLLLDFFKALAEKVRGMFDNDEQYYLYLRNLQYSTLGGDWVESKGEKYIADFMLEHEITKDNKELEYKYEYNVKKFVGSDRPYRPDFSLFFKNEKNATPQAVIEYFGVTESHRADRGYMNSEEEQKYLEKIPWAENICKDAGIKFLAMSVDDFDVMRFEESDQKEVLEREKFEQLLQSRLIDKGFSVSGTLSIKEIFNKMHDTKSKRDLLVRQMTQFINRAQKLSYDPKKVQELFEEKRINKMLNKRHESFLEIVIGVYAQYREGLDEKGYIDFDGLFTEAIKRIGFEGERCSIVSSDEKQQIKNLKYILIDEYQDFSKLFYELIDAIRVANSSISFFCVGDDWQAINGFAGSDLEYFNNFERYFAGGRRAELLINNRSYGDIVYHSNLSMSEVIGAGGKAKDGNPDGNVHLGSVLFVDKEAMEDRKYLSAAEYESNGKKGINFDFASYLKTIDKIVQQNPDKGIYLLFRSNDLCRVSRFKFQAQVQEWCPEPKRIKKNIDGKEVMIDRVSCSTVHSFKGGESDIVIIVGANRRNFPKIHPDNELMELLGVTIQKVLEEEKRLFYVAITRAKEKLYLLYEEEKGRSDFISEMKSKGWRYLPI